MTSSPTATATVSTDVLPPALEQSLRKFLTLRAQLPEVSLTPDEAREVAILEIAAAEFHEEASPYGPSLRAAAKRLLAKRIQEAQTIEQRKALASDLASFDSTAHIRHRTALRSFNLKAGAAAQILLGALQRSIAVLKAHRAAIEECDLKGLDVDRGPALRAVDAKISQLEISVGRAREVIGGSGRARPRELASPFGFNFQAICVAHGLEPPRPNPLWAGLRGTAATLEAAAHRFDNAPRPPTRNEIRREKSARIPARSQVAGVRPGAITEEPINAKDSG
jgi:hypothetical protein